MKYKIYQFMFMVLLFLGCSEKENNKDCDYFASGAEATVEVINNKSVTIAFEIESDFAVIQGGRNIPAGRSASFAVLSGVKSYSFAYQADLNPSSGNGYKVISGTIDVKRCENNKLVIN